MLYGHFMNHTETSTCGDDFLATKPYGMNHTNGIYCRRLNKELAAYDSVNGDSIAEIAHIVTHIQY